MVANYDQRIGAIGLFLLGISFLYYSVWVLIIIPFVNKGHYVLNYFPSKEYAFIPLVSAGLIIVTCSCIFVGIVILKNED